MVRMVPITIDRYEKKEKTKKENANRSSTYEIRRRIRWWVRLSTIDTAVSLFL